MKSLLLVCFVVIATRGKNYFEDAVSGGLDTSGKLIFIGQVLFEGMLIPGKIFRNDKRIYIEWAGMEKAVEANIKVLCSSHAYKFDWLQTSNANFYLLHDKILIKGGYEPNFFTYIGRIKIGETVNIGKVICASDCLGLYTTKNGSLNLYTHFQVLAYNPLMEHANVIW
ncbi:hypothetical protein PPYR_12614 [Photinus pyralis]|uniref:Uncharacterized protein n=1 Tax=Photinus pyralis TaxID=7054 RepID=A0A5N4A6N3_PHOPY|nr:hypothetical protein PPYR_12614 [Photinus pyralis]